MSKTLPIGCDHRVSIADTHQLTSIADTHQLDQIGVFDAEMLHLARWRLSADRLRPPRIGGLGGCPESPAGVPQHVGSCLLSRHAVFFLDRSGPIYQSIRICLSDFVEQDSEREEIAP